MRIVAFGRPCVWLRGGSCNALWEDIVLRFGVALLLCTCAVGSLYSSWRSVVRLSFVPPTCGSKSRVVPMRSMRRYIPCYLVGAPGGGGELIAYGCD